MEIRTYDHERDFGAVQRTWREVGWISGSDEHKGLREFLGVGHPTVGIIEGEAECLVHWTPGRLRYEVADVSLATITAVTTSRVARRQGLASTMTAAALGDAAERGAHVAMLGMFDQGFYDRLGFGTGTYEHQWTFDPHSLKVDTPYRSPVRLSLDDAEAIHACMANRHRPHGGVVLDPPGIMRAEMEFVEDSFALGFRNGDSISHCIVGAAKGEGGPYRFDFIAYQDHHQLMELLTLIRELGDQVLSVKMMEPPGVRLQDLLDRPFRQRARTRRSEHETINNAFAWWQVRLLDIPAGVAHRHWQGRPVAFNLAVTDPLASQLDGSWSGVAGDYVVEVGAESSATPGSSPALPRLEASVGAFSRLWLGVQSATGLSITDDLAGPLDLLAQLDEAFSLPAPSVGIPF